ncbi:helix-turn-helix domain-containing protein [[Eubacterium] hominis]|uniref:helix-turn-helix domain-containing protein n=1 Tax=[Eubacterium] hominis TaxID=2764325 RepID=UPI003A4DFF98
MNDLSILIPILDELYARTHIPILILDAAFQPVYPMISSPLFQKVIQPLPFSFQHDIELIVEDHSAAYATISCCLNDQNYTILCGCLLHQLDQNAIPTRIQALIPNIMLHRHITSEHLSTFTSFIKTLSMIVYTKKISEQDIHTIYFQSKDLSQDEDTLTIRRLVQSTPGYYAWEQKFFSSFTLGRFDTMKTMLKEMHRYDIEEVHPETLEIEKYKLVSFITLLTRTAIHEGALVDQAFSLSDEYLNRIKELPTKQNSTFIEDAMIEFYALCPKSKERHSPYIHQCIQFIDTHLYDRISLKDLSNVIGVSASYLAVIFKEELKETTTQYIQRKKIEEAQRLLLFTNKSSSEISSLLSFQSQSSFIQVFKKVCGMTPKQFQAQERKLY